VDAAAHYRHLLTLGRDEFLAAAAPAVLLRYRARYPDPMATGMTTPAADHAYDHTLDRAARETLDDLAPHGRFTPEPLEMELYPLAKKPGASFRDRITIGRTPNNDVVIADPSVSRLHAYARQADGWLVADAGSKNGSWLDDVPLDARRETALSPGAVLRLGDVRLLFYRSEELFDVLGGDDGRR
jgi:Inner membrane component of T3SS, cytoplasmic domain